MSALCVNSSLHQFGFGAPLLDNALMHKRRRQTPLAKLMDSYQGGQGIGDNELSRLTKVPQSTITRIANGTTKEAKEAQLRPIADFFGVSTAQLRGVEGKKAGAIVAESRTAVYQDLSPEAVHVARVWSQLSPGRRQKFLEEMSWANFFEGKFPPYRLGIANMASHDKFTKSVEADWEKMMRQARLPLED